jgi:hypothetical protein
MRLISRLLAATVLSMTLFAFSAIADCGEMTNGTKCLVGVDAPEPTKTIDKKPTHEIGTDFFAFVRMMYGRIFG